MDISKEKEESINYRRIMCIPVAIRKGQDHPTLNEKVFKGKEFQDYALLYHHLQRTALDPKLKFLENVEKIKSNLEELEVQIVNPTKLNINTEEQNKGKLIQRLPSDAQAINDLSSCFFAIIHEICRHTNLTSMVPIVPHASIQTNSQAVITEKMMPGVASMPISKQLNDVFKRAKSIRQRVQILLNAIWKFQKVQPNTPRIINLKINMSKSYTRLLKQQHLFIDSLEKTFTICNDIASDRKSRIHAIELARNRRIFDNMNEYHTVVIETQGKEDFDNYIRNAKQEIFGSKCVAAVEKEEKQKMPKHMRLTLLLPRWIETVERLHHENTTEINLAKKAKYGTK
jgi:hypothetical protein